MSRTETLWSAEDFDNTTIYAKFRAEDYNAFSLLFTASAVNDASATLTFWGMNPPVYTYDPDETSDTGWTEITTFVNGGTMPDFTSVTSAAINDSLANYEWVRIKLVGGNSSGACTITATLGLMRT